MPTCEYEVLESNPANDAFAFCCDIFLLHHFFLVLKFWAQVYLSFSLLSIFYLQSMTLITLFTANAVGSM